MVDAVKALALMRNPGGRAWEVPIATSSAAGQAARRAAGVDGGSPMEEWMRAGEPATLAELAAAADLVRAAVPLAALGELLTEGAR